MHYAITRIQRVVKSFTLTKKLSIVSIGGGGYSHLRVMLVLVKFNILRFAGFGSPTDVSVLQHDCTFITICIVYLVLVQTQLCLVRKERDLPHWNFGHN